MVYWNPDKIPTVEWEEKTLASTNLLTYRELGKYRLSIPFDEYHRASIEVINEITKRKLEHQIEISCLERFKTILLRLNFTNPDTVNQLAKSLTACHMQILANATTMPIMHIRELEKLKKNYKIGLLSNFDDAQTAHKILKEKKIEALFSSITISEQVGIRKPSPKIFSIALESLKVNADETLFVGDSWGEDIVGAAKAGIDSVWINSNRNNLKEKIIKHPFKKRVFCIPSITNLSFLVEKAT